MYSSALESEGHVARAPSVSMRVERRCWIAITSTWLETPANAHDYFALRVDVAETPRGIVLNEDDTGALSIVSPWSSIGLSASPIIHIDILHRVVGDDGAEPEDDFLERATYDHALLLRQKDGSRVCIAQKDGSRVCIAAHRVTWGLACGGCMVPAGGESEKASQGPTDDTRRPASVDK